jgi:hypothetical protein
MWNNFVGFGVFTVFTEAFYFLGYVSKEHLASVCMVEE